MTDDIAPKKLIPLKQHALKFADTTRGLYIAIVPNDTTFEDVMTPGFWANHVAANGPLSALPFARVEVVREDGTMDLDLRVISTAPGMAKMRCLRKIVDDTNLGTARAQAEAAARPTPDELPEELQAPEGYKIGHAPNGAQKGYWVQMKSNSQMLGKGYGDRATAVAVAKKHKLEAETSVEA